MENYTTDAINIKTYPISENDNIVVMFSKENGLIRGVAKGVKRPKSKLGARMQVLVANTLLLDKRRNLDIIKEASALNPFNKLRYDFDKLTCALYVAETVNSFCTETVDKEQNEAIYRIIYLTLNNIQNSKNKSFALLNVIKFQLHFMRELGFGIELEKCLKCSKKPEYSVFFHYETGGIVCPSCAQAGLRYIKIHQKIRSFLLALNNTPLDKKTEFDDLINEKLADGCFNLLKRYIEIIGSKKSKTFKVMEETKAG
ncbi:MAG: DNA repair protein RecO [Candidatus Gastranaerophilales bacterium]|nr:DNA repair protein RecO [Candidatus Gastranaerophilales bacterium]